jgi:subfamily B ATP-binding cassette protein MsbA
MRRLFRYYFPYRRTIGLAIISNVLMSFFTIISIPVLQPFLQILLNPPASPAGPEAVNGASLDTTKTPLSGFKALEQQSSAFFAHLIEQNGREKALLVLCGFLVLVFFFKNLFRYLSMYFLAPVRNGVVRDIRQKLVAKILFLPLAYFSEERKGDLMSRISSDVQEIETSILGVVEAIAREPLVIIGSIALMVYVSPQLLLFVLGLMLFSALIIAGVGRTLRRQSGEAQRRLGLLGALVEETLGGLRIIRGFNAEAWQMDRYKRENDGYARILIGIYRRKDLASPLSEFLGITVVSILLWFGAKQVFSGSISAATFITFLYAFYNVIEPAKALSGAIYSIRKGMGAVERVHSVLDADFNILELKDAAAITDFKGSIEFRNVSFKYPNSDLQAVSNIDLVIPHGKIVALVGASGSGKSTIADLLPRFYDVTDGAILVDGIDVRHLRLHDLRALMGIVSQEAILFHDSVQNNIAFGQTHSGRQDVEAAAKAANAHDFISAMPEGYDTNIGDRGTKLSGGQRQRLTIARALLKNPPILILDEATSALDSESEKLVQAALDKLLTNRTALVIAHRLSTIQHADEIVVLDKGRIVERGTHERLMLEGKFYRKLVELQAL